MIYKVQKFTFNLLYHSPGLSNRQPTGDIFLYFHRKQDIWYFMRCRQFAWTVKFCFLVCFLEKVRSKFPNVCWNLYPEYLASKQKHFRLTVKGFKLQAGRGECATYVHTKIKALNSFHTLYEPQRHKTSENVPSDLCAQRRFRSACAVAQSDQILHRAYLG